MKKFLCLFVLIILLITQILFAGCNKNREKPIIATNGEFKEWYDKLPKGQIEKASRFIEDFNCALLEDNLLQITDVIRAKYLGTGQANKDYLHEFQVIESFKCDYPDSFIYVYQKTYELDGHSLHIIEYEKDTEYLLLLKRVETQYMSVVMFQTVANGLIIPFGNNGEIDFSKSKVCKYNLTDTVKDSSLKESMQNGKFIDEILSRCSCVSDNTNFIQNTDMENVLKKSQCILKVKVNYHSSSRNFADSFYFKRYDCTVLEMLKGDCFSDSEHVTIVLPTYDVNFSEQRFENQTIIVAVQKDKVFGDLEISSRNSIYSVSDYDEITRIINELNAAP